MERGCIVWWVWRWLPTGARVEPPERHAGVSLQFRLTYRGKLPSASRTNARRAEKHAIRKQLHQQLAELWQVHPFLRGYTAHTVSAWRSIVSGGTPAVQEVPGPSILSHIADRYAKCGYRFVPLIGSAFGVDAVTACALDILFLRRDMPGSVVSGGGDIDNRIKVLFDALRMPDQCEQVDGFPPADNKNPFFCLLEDDSLITEVKISTDRLLTPPADNEHMNDVHLIINVRAIVIRSPIGFPEFALAFGI